MFNSDTDGQSLTIGMWIEKPVKDSSDSELAAESHVTVNNLLGRTSRVVYWVSGIFVNTFGNT